MNRKSQIKVGSGGKRGAAAARYAVWIAISTIIVAALYYVYLPPINAHSGEFWTFFIFSIAVFVVLDLVINSISAVKAQISGSSFSYKPSAFPKRIKIVVIAVIILVVALIVLSMFSSEFLRSGAYSSVVTIEDGVFEEDIAETEYVKDIALMDTTSAQIIGARTLGSLSDLVSQYEVAENYSQIAYNSVPYKVAPLEYASFFKWISNKDKGIPGYVLVDPVNFEADFVRLEDGYIQYSPSAYFSKNLMRTLRFKYPTAIFGEINFEIDEDGRPFWVCPIMKPRAGWFGAKDVNGVVILDACTGDSKKFDLDSIPDWIDIVYNGKLICEKYDWHGELSGGYINYMFSQTGCVATTDDFGYKVIGNDVYVYTGVTSLSNDEANIGFILVNARTGKYKFYSIPGAEEYSAMAAAEGTVQQYRYSASFPSLINVKGEPTYIMVLKDASQIVKMYAMVNVKNYNNIAVTATTQNEVYEKYLDAIGATDVEDDVKEDELESEEITVEQVNFITKGGDTLVYIKSDGGEIYKIPFTEDALFISGGDNVTVWYKQKENITELYRIER